MLPADIPPLPPLPAGTVLTLPAAALPRLHASMQVPAYGVLAERVALRARRDGEAPQDGQPPPLPPGLMNDDDAQPTRERSFSAWIEQCMPRPVSDHGDVWAELDDIAGYNAHVAAELQRAIDMPVRFTHGLAPASSGTSLPSTFKQKVKLAVANGLSAIYAGLHGLGAALRDALRELFS